MGQAYIYGKDFCLTKGDVHIIWEKKENEQQYLR